MLSEAIRFGQREKLKVIKEKKIKIGYEFEFHPYQKLYENDSDEIIKEVLTSFSDDDFTEYLPDLSYFKEVYDTVSNINLEPEDIEILLDNIENKKLTKGGNEVLSKIYYGIKIQEDVSLNRSEIFDLFSFEDDKKHFLDNALDLIKKINKFEEHEDLLLQPELKEFLENYNELNEVSIKDIKTLIHTIPPSFKEKLVDVFNTMSEGEYINKTIMDMRIKTLFPSTYKLISNIILEHDSQVEIITKHIDIEHSLILFSQIMKIMKLYGYTSNHSGLHVNVSYDGDHSNISFLKYYTLLNTVSVHKRFPERLYTMDLIVEDEFNILDIEIQDYINNSNSPTMMNVINIVKKTLNNTVLGKYKNVNASFKQFIKDNGRIELRYIGGEGYEDREEEIYNDILRSAQLLEIMYTKDSEKEFNKELLRLLDNVFQKNRNSTFFEYIKELVKAKHTHNKEAEMNEATYKGNIGIMEITKFFQLASDSDKSLFKEYVKQKLTKKAWELVQRATGVKLQGEEFN